MKTLTLGLLLLAAAASAEKAPPPEPQLHDIKLSRPGAMLGYAELAESLMAAGEDLAALEVYYDAIIGHNREWAAGSLAERRDQLRELIPQGEAALRTDIGPRTGYRPRDYAITVRVQRPAEDEGAAYDKLRVCLANHGKALGHLIFLRLAKDPDPRAIALDEGYLKTFREQTAFAEAEVKRFKPAPAPASKAPPPAPLKNPRPWDEGPH